MLTGQLVDDVRHIQLQFYSTLDFQMEPFSIGEAGGRIVYLSSLVNGQMLVERVMQPLQRTLLLPGRAAHLLLHVQRELMTGLITEFTSKMDTIVSQLLDGAVVIVLDGSREALVVQVGNVAERAIAEPSTQTIIRGPKDSFNESLMTNIGLVRKRLKNRSLTFELHNVGRCSPTKVSIAYVGQIVKPELVVEVRERIIQLNVDAILDSGQLEELIHDSRLFLFPLIQSTERPDGVTGHLLEGKIAIFVDGSPFILIVPATFNDFFQSPEDYYEPYLVSSFVRLLRYTSFFIALLLPAIYVSLTAFHRELLPTDLLISIQAQRVGVPFPVVVELLIMEMTFEILREAGTRMPRAVGQTVSIVGALVLGQAAVEAGIVSNVLVIIVALTAIASFVSPIYNFTISTRLIRFIFIGAAAIFGIFGIVLVLLVMLLHMTSLRSFGVSYMAPFAPLSPTDLDDTIIRAPSWLNRYRPTFLQPLNRRRKG